MKSLTYEHLYSGNENGTDVLLLMGSILNELKLLYSPFRKIMFLRPYFIHLLKNRTNKVIVKN